MTEFDEVTIRWEGRDSEQALIKGTRRTVFSRGASEAQIRAEMRDLIAKDLYMPTSQIHTLEVTERKPLQAD